VSSISTIQPNADPTTGRPTDLQDVDVSQFLDLLIAELRSQDPLDPMDNAEMAQQIGQIREIAATDKLSATLSAVSSGQSLTTASSLIGKEVEALSESGDAERGVVDKVTVEVDEDDSSLRRYQIHINGQAFDLDRVREVNAGS